MTRFGILTLSLFTFAACLPAEPEDDPRDSTSTTDLPTTGDSGGCADVPEAGTAYGPCTMDGECAAGLLCQIADQPKGSICLPTCWRRGQTGACDQPPEVCGGPLAESVCTSEEDPLRPVPCVIGCAVTDGCPDGLVCFIDRCVWAER